MDGSSTDRHQATPDNREPYGLFSDSDGNLRIGGLPQTYREGFGSLLDLFHPPGRFRVMPGDEITRLSFQKVGAALRQAMAAWRSRPRY